MLKVMFVEKVDGELKQVAEREYAFNIPNRMDFTMLNGSMYVVTDRMFDYDSGYVDCLVVKSDDLKKNRASDESDGAQE